MEAASLSVAITGDASGLLSAVNTANAALSQLKSSAQGALDSLKDKTVKITAVDNTAAGVASAKAAINSLNDKTVTVTVNYKTTGSPGKAFARGTRNAPRGLALINDERGVPDPRELIYHDGRYMMYGGRDVIVPLDRGDKVYTAAQTKEMMRAMGIPSYASGYRNEAFEAEKKSFSHMTRSSNMTLDEQIAWWRETLEKFAYDYEAVKECQEEIFALTRKLTDSINDTSGAYIDERNFFGDWETYADSAIAAFGRVKENNEKFLNDGFITYEEYLKNVERAGERLYDGRIEQSEKWLEQERKYNNLSADEYIAGLERMADYTREYFENGLIDYAKYIEGMQEINNSIYDMTAKKNADEYKAWEKDAALWYKQRDTYGDWAQKGDSPTKYYERCIERVKEFYEAGKISWEQYTEDTAEYEMELYKARKEQFEADIEQKRDYISELKAKFRAQEEKLKLSWEEQDRTEDLSKLREQVRMYSYAVTQKGQNRYEELKTQLKQLEREEELAELQSKNNEIIERLEKQLNAAEASKRGMLGSIISNGADTNMLIAGIVRDTAGIQSFLATMFERLIDAVNASARANSYTDNSSKTYNIKTGASAALSALASSLGKSFMYR